jgi:hypothetical protein
MEIVSTAVINSIKTLISFVAYFLIIFGLGYLFAPKLIEEINVLVNRVLLYTDKLAFTYRFLTGIAFILIAFFLLVLISLK